MTDIEVVDQTGDNVWEVDGSTPGNKYEVRLRTPHAFAAVRKLGRGTLKQHALVPASAEDEAEGRAFDVYRVRLQADHDTFGAAIKLAPAWCVKSPRHASAITPVGTALEAALLGAAAGALAIERHFETKKEGALPMGGSPSA